MWHRRNISLLVDHVRSIIHLLFLWNVEWLLNNNSTWPLRNSRENNWTWLKSQALDYRPGSLSFLFLKNNCLFLAVLGLRCCTWAFSCCEWGLLPSCAAQASRCSGVSRCGGSRHTSFHSCTTQALYSRCTGLAGPQHVGIFLDQGLNPCCLYCKSDDSPLDHQGSPAFFSPINSLFPSCLIYQFSSFLWVSGFHLWIKGVRLDKLIVI